MLDIGENNLFLTNEFDDVKLPGGLIVHGGHYIISNIINYYDDMGKNCLYMCIDNTNMNLTTTGCGIIKYSSPENLTSRLFDNLFRVDILVVDAFNDIRKNIQIIDNIRSITQLPLILIGEKSYNFPSKEDFDYVYSFYKINDSNTQPWNITRMSMDSSKLSNIVDMKNEITFTLEDLKTRYIRDIKIDNIFNGK